MLEELKEIAVGEMLTIDNPDVLELTGTEDFTVVCVKSYTQDEGDVLIIDLDLYYLVAHTLLGEPRYYLVERTSSGTPDNLEDDGFRLILRGEAMPRKLYSGRNDHEITYIAKHGPVYGMNVERDDSPPEIEPGDISICGYRGKTKIKLMSVILLERLDDCYTLYQGFQISEANILL